MVPEMGLSPSAAAAPVGQAFQPDAESANVRLESLTYLASSPGEKGDCPLSPAWYAAAVLACLLGMACKEVMVTAPLVVLLYDRTFLAGSFADAFRRRWGLYLGLAATWGLLAYLVYSTGLIARQSEMGAPNVGSYARTQPEVILHYLRLSFWPSGLRLKYGWPVATTVGEILPAAIVVGLLLAATVWGLLARRAWGFLGAWFFLILAPTSSILPLNQLLHERRMYLSLAAVAVLVAAGGYALWDRLLPRPAVSGRRATAARWAGPVAVLSAAVTALGSATVQRNSVYQSLLTFWQDAAEKRPDNPVAHLTLGATLAAMGRTSEAIEHYHQALQLNPDYVYAHNNLGADLATLGKWSEAIEHYHKALQLSPDYAEAHNNLGIALAALGRADEAIEHYRTALRLKADYADAHNNLGNALADAGKTEEAIEHYRAALRIKPDYAEAHDNLGLLLDVLGRTPAAIEHYQQALRSKPDFAEAHNNLGKALADAGRMPEAIAHWEQAIRLKPDYAEAHHNLGNALVLAGKWREAIERYREALRSKPDYLKARDGLARAHYRLAGFLVSTGRTHEAVEHYNEILQLLPDAPEALIELAWLLATHEPAQGGDPARAVQLAQRSRQVGGQENAQCLDALAAAYAAAGRFAEAVTTAERAVRLAESAGQTTLLKNIQSRLELYRAGQPYREASRPASR
jgi:tetratricopeptide (TPR) repeat protein